MDLTAHERERVTHEVIRTLRAGDAAEVYTTITGRIRGGAATAPMTGSWRADDYAVGFACAICGVTSDTEIGCGHYKAKDDYR